MNDYSVQQSHPDHALAIQIGSRYFAKFGKKGQVMTAWCLAGAKLFRIDCTGGNELIARLTKKRVKFTVRRVAAQICATGS